MGFGGGAMLQVLLLCLVAGERVLGVALYEEALVRRVLGGASRFIQSAQHVSHRWKPQSLQLWRLLPVFRCSLQRTQCLKFKIGRAHV